jgi:hypothetical protein
MIDPSHAEIVDMSPTKQAYRPVARITTDDYKRICNLACTNVASDTVPHAADSAAWAMIEHESYRLLLDAIDRQGVDVSRPFVQWRDPETLADCFRNKD